MNIISVYDDYEGLLEKLFQKKEIDAILQGRQIKIPVANLSILNVSLDKENKEVFFDIKVKTAGDLYTGEKTIVQSN